ncbi:hypothetical protein BaRGS_00016993 [Batillaria attramentaria]|uniref:Solute carrier organic anion transporter family member n=1 Tax=Batillaria attramentaria TaxID=370345 RepID=A0ABD0KXB2_9CAEN
MSANDISFLVVVLLVSHFCKNSHTPRILGAAYVGFGLSGVAIAAMYFASPKLLTDMDAPGYNQTKDNTKYLCVAGATDRTFNEGCEEGGGGESNSNLPLVVVFGLLLGVQGVSKATRSPLGATYIDNNVENRARTGFHLEHAGFISRHVLVGCCPDLTHRTGRIPVQGIMLTLVLMGPAVGFAMGGVFSRIPVDLSDISMSLSDPRWIGAWWLGFLVIGIATLVTSLPLFCFPRHMPNRRTIAYEEDDMEKAKDGDRTLADDKAVKDAIGNGDVSTQSTNDEKIDDVKVSPATEGPGDVTANGDVFKTPSSDGKADDGTDDSVAEASDDDEKAARKIKVLLKDLPLSVYRLLRRPVFVILVLALGMHIFAVVGFSSFLIKFVERQFGLPAWKSSSIFGLSNLVFGGLGTFTGGVLVSRLNLTRRGCLRWVVFSTALSTILSAITIFLGCGNEPIVGLRQRDFSMDDGHSACHCDVSQFLPVCGGRQSFLSPCHAGCTKAANSSVYKDCGFTADGYASLGLCDPACYLLIPFIVVQVLSTGVGTSAVTPVYVTILRSATERDKTLAMGLVSFIMSLIGFIPAPIVYGAVIDTACVLWSSTCGKTGACALYDVNRLRQRYIGLKSGSMAAAVLCYAAALLVLTWQVRRGTDKDEKLGVTEAVVPEEGKVTGEKSDSNGSVLNDAQAEEKQESSDIGGIHLTTF